MNAPSDRSTTHTCTVRKKSQGRWDFNPGLCGKPAKEKVGDEWLCGIHLAARRKRAERDREWTERSNADRLHRERVAALSDKHGLKIVTQFDHKGRAIHDRVSVPLADLLRLLGED